MIALLWEEGNAVGGVGRRMHVLDKNGRFAASAIR